MAPGGHAAPRDQYAPGEVAATQHTLNYALGNLGGRQKSWMTTGDATSPIQNPNPPPPTTRRKPSKTLRMDPRKQLQKTLTQGPGRETHPGNHTVSKSISPQLANMVTQQANGAPALSPTAVLPSPSPSEDATMENVPTSKRPNVPKVPSTVSAQGIASPRMDRDLSGNTLQDARPMHSPRQAVLISKRPVEGSPAETDKRARIESLANEPRPISRQKPPPLRPPVPSQSQQQSDSSRRTSLGPMEMGSPSATFVQAISPSLSHQSQSPQQWHYAHPSVPQGMQPQTYIQPQAGGPSPVPSPSFAQQPFGVPPSIEAQNPRAQRSAQGSPASALHWYTQQDCVQALNAFFANHRTAVKSTQEKNRLKVLGDAVQQQDWSFLAIHQYYCLMAVDLKQIPAAIRDDASLSSGVQLLRRVLDTNDRVSSGTLHFFANFPKPLPQLQALYPNMWSQQASMFINLIRHSANLDALQQICEQRNYPPLMRELFYDLGITSTVFQRIVFTAILRSIWATWKMFHQPLQGEFEQQALNFFCAHQEDFYLSQARRPSIQFHNQEHQWQHHRQERELEFQQWGTQFLRLCGGYHSALLQSASEPILQSQQVPAMESRGQEAQQIRQAPAQNPLPSQGPVPHMSPHSAQANLPRGRGRPRGRGQPHLSPQQPAPPAPMGNQQAPRVLPSNVTSLLPRQGVNQPQQRQPNPCRFALHEAHLRSPTLRARSARSMLYHHIVSFLMPPKPLTVAGHKVEKWTFNLPHHVVQLIPKEIPNAAGAPPTLDINEKSLMLRLRCVKWTSDIPPDEHTWSVADTSWVPYSYFTINGTDLQQRKKLHYGKDLPINISSLVKEGGNTLEIAILREPDDESYRQYLLAIEALGITSHATIKDASSKANHVDAGTSLELIKQKLSGSDGDDEVAIVQSHLTINLFDPFSASKICDIPARGKACRHNDCFDLETFLLTRQRKGDASVTDQWKCPICGCDARPQHLIVDGFLEEVRKKLEQEGLLETRAIILDPNGSWKPKPEVCDPNGVQDSRSPEPKRASTSRQPSLHADVIDLSD